MTDEQETYDWVGIVMAKSEEGDSVARVLGEREGVEIIEQPSFWEIKARDRLVTTDDALMLFSDPLEAMEYLSR
jgi:propane monooxygenase coupling protein